jgi:SAM-dependent methyltransferase
MPEIAILNLGAGNKLVPGAVQHDLVKHRPEIDVAWDLNEMPWPWADSSFDLIVARAVFEHLDRDLVQSLNECWRILRPGGLLSIKLPYWKADAAYEDPTHRWFFTLGSLAQFDPDTERGKQYAFYTKRQWQIVKGPRLNQAQTSIFWTLRVRK